MDETFLGYCYLHDEIGIKIKYKLKMYRPEIFWTVLAFATLFFSFTLPIFLLLLVMEIMILLRRPRKFFERRLNDYFVVIHYPFSKWHGIFQSPKRYIYSSGFSNCKVFFRDLSKQMIGLFDLVGTGKGYYRLTTHEVIKKRIELLDQQGKLKILCCKPAYKKSLTRLQDSLLHCVCRQCPDAGHCCYRESAKGRRQFYYIEFRVHV